jgi:hypothetical protein
MDVSLSAQTDAALSRLTESCSAGTGPTRDILRIGYTAAGRLTG